MCYLFESVSGARKLRNLPFELTLRIYRLKLHTKNITQLNTKFNFSATLFITNFILQIPLYHTFYFIY